MSLPKRASVAAARHLLHVNRVAVRTSLMLTPKPTAESIKLLRKQAKAFLPDRLAALAAHHHFVYQKIRLSNATSRWGSCSSRGTISLNIQLMRLSPELIDYVLLHELSHTRHLNHGPAFWRQVSEVCPQYKMLRQKLRQLHPHDTHKA